VAYIADGRVKLRLSPSGHEDSGAFFGEPLGGGESYPAIGTRDDSDFAFQSSHRRSPSIIEPLSTT
jgi:hypothetical protein